MGPRTTRRTYVRSAAEGGRKGAGNRAGAACSRLDGWKAGWEHGRNAALHKNSTIDLLAACLPTSIDRLPDCFEDSNGNEDDRGFPLSAASWVKWKIKPLLHCIPRAL